MGHHQLKSLTAEGGRRVTRCYTLWSRGEALRGLWQSLSSSLSCTQTVEPSLWVSDPRSGIIVRLMAVSTVRASAEKKKQVNPVLESLIAGAGA